MCVRRGNSTPCKLAWMYCGWWWELGAVWAGPLDLGLLEVGSCFLACCGRSGTSSHPRAAGLTFDSIHTCPVESAQVLPLACPFRRPGKEGQRWWGEHLSGVWRVWRSWLVLSDL